MGFIYLHYLIARPKSSYHYKHLFQISYVYIVTFLETFLLVGMSSQLSKLLIVYTEIVQLPRPGNRKQTVIGIITGIRTTTS